MNNEKTGALEHVRKARHKISEQFDNDPQKLVTYYIELQKKYKERIIDVKEQEPENAV